MEQQRWLEGEVERLGSLETIVRGVAARDPITDLDREYGIYVCLMCPDDHDEDEHRPTADEVVHHENCPWRQAREWVEAHSETGR